MKLILSLTTIPTILLTASLVRAQAPSVNPGDFGSSSQIQQPGGFSNPNSSSRQFFQQDRDKLYFLEDTDPVLEIDDEVSTETENSERETEKNQQLDRTTETEKSQ